MIIFISGSIESNDWIPTSFDGLRPIGIARSDENIALYEYDSPHMVEESSRGVDGVLYELDSGSVLHMDKIAFISGRQRRIVRVFIGGRAKFAFAYLTKRQSLPGGARKNITGVFSSLVA